MNRPSVKKIISVMRSKNYRVFDTPTVDWNLNIVGIRNSNMVPQKFDDLLVVFHRFMGVWDASYYPITTDPSLHYLRKPINSKGTAILMEGQYLSTYKIGIHRPKNSRGHQAICQRLGKVNVYRDNNRNGSLDINETTVDSGMHGINIHKGPRNGDAESDNTIFSAGCQVFADSRHFEEFMLKCKYGREAFGNSFTYTLLSENDFKEI